MSHLSVFIAPQTLQRACEANPGNIYEKLSAMAGNIFKQLIKKNVSSRAQLYVHNIQNINQCACVIRYPSHPPLQEQVAASTR